MTVDNEVPVQSIRRGCEALDLLAGAGLQGRAVSLQEVAAQLGVPSSTAHNILKSLIGCGYARRQAEGGYTLGPRCFELARSAVVRERHRLSAAASAVVHEVSAATGESVVLAMLVNGHRQALLRVEGTATVRVDAAFESRERFWDVVTGRVLAAFAAPDELAAVLAVNGLPGSAWGGLETPERLREALAEVRAAGLAEAVADSGDVAALAVPVRDPDGAATAALGLYLPAYRATPERLAELRAATLGGAERIADQW